MPPHHLSVRSEKTLNTPTSSSCLRLNIPTPQPLGRSRIAVHTLPTTASGSLHNNHLHASISCTTINLPSSDVDISLLNGVYEELELRDGGSDYLGKGVSKVNQHSELLLFPDFGNIPTGVSPFPSMLSRSPAVRPPLSSAMDSRPLDLLLKEFRLLWSISPSSILDDRGSRLHHL
ncbi:hypothetical protein L1887_01208 [Cichorium endivia]|nr:hypothetical protein L1887_01208 [Cichorium endivia]